VLVVDDIVTTGASACESVRVLHIAGAHVAGVLAIANAWRPRRLLRGQSNMKNWKRVREFTGTTGWTRTTVGINHPW